MTDFVLADATAIDSTVARAATGDEAAFAQLIEAHHASMARVAYVICGDAEVTRDAVQAAWATAWRRLSDVRDPSRIRSWLVAVAANETRQVMRRERRASIVDLSAIPEPTSDDDLSNRIATMDLARVLRGLKPEDRALLALRFVAGLDSSEIAVELGGTASGIRSRLSRLIERLRDDLDAGEAYR